jgi:hypothetical protein
MGQLFIIFYADNFKNLFEKVVMVADIIVAKKIE